MADEILDTVDYTEIVDERVKKAVLDNYVNTPEFAAQFEATKATLPQMDKFNDFLKKSVSIGVSPDIALELFVFTLSMK